MTVAWCVIVLAASWVGFAYVGYPLVLLALRRLAPRPVHRAEVFPPVSLIIAVHNAGEALRTKLENSLELEYPTPPQILVASDGSTDTSEAIAASFAPRGVRVVRSLPRRGKEAAQAAAVAEATGEVLVFTDVGARLEPETLRALVRPFADARVGAVSSEDAVGSAGGEGAYVRFEMALRRLESETTTLIGLSGSLFAVRRELADPWPPDLASDFRCALEAARRGQRAVCEPGARAHFGASDVARSQWSRKVRTVRRGLAVLSAYRCLLHPRAGRVALSLWGHKAARFTAPWALLALLGASAVAADASPVATGLLAAQLGLYGLGALALALPALEAWLPGRLAAFFLVLNASTLVAWLYHLSGRRAVTWQPTRR